MKGRIRKQLLAATLGVSLLQPVALGVLGSLLLGAATGMARAQQRLNTEDIARIAQAITVRIEGATQGSGVLVKREGNRYTVLTAWHVVSGQRPGEELDIYTPDGRRHPVKAGAIQKVGGVDMATLSFESNNIYQVATIGDSGAFTRGNPATVAGFPRTKPSSILVSTGAVIANADIGIDNGYQLIYATRTELGMSGGPVLDSTGRLVAIHGRGELDSFVSEVTSSAIKTGANKGVPINHFFNLSGTKTSQGSAGAPVSADDYISQAIALVESDGAWDDVGIQSTAIKLFNKAIEIQPTSESYMYRGGLKAQIKDFEGGLSDLKKARQLNPLDHKIVGALIALYIELGKKELGSQLLFEYLDEYIQPIPPEGISLFLDHLEKIGDKSTALMLVNKAISRNIIDPNLLVQRARVKKWSGDKIGAITDFKAAIQEGYTGWEYGIPEIVREVEGSKGVIDLYNSMIAKRPRNSTLYWLRASEREQAGDLQGFYADSVKTFELSSRRALDYVRLSKAKLKIGDKNGSRQDLETAAKLLSSERDSGENAAYRMGSVYQEVAQLQREVGEIQAALHTLNMAIIKFPKDESNYYSRALLKKNSLDDLAGAIDDYKTAAKLSKYDWLAVRFWAGEVESQFFESNDKRHILEAISIYDVAIANRPREEIFYFSRAELNFKIGNLDSALEDLNKAVALGNRYYKERAMLLLRLGRDAEAADDIDRAISLLDSSYGFDYAEIADILHGRLGQTQKALNLLNSGLNAMSEGRFSDNIYSSRAEIKASIGDYVGACADHRKAILINVDNFRSSEWLRSNAARKCP